MTADATLLVLRDRLIVKNVTVNALILTEVPLVGLLWNVHDTRSISICAGTMGTDRVATGARYFIAPSRNLTVLETSVAVHR